MKVSKFAKKIAMASGIGQLMDDLFVASKPQIKHIDEHIFKYYVDFDQISITDEVKQAYDAA